MFVTIFIIYLFCIIVLLSSRLPPLSYGRLRWNMFFTIWPLIVFSEVTNLITIWWSFFKMCSKLQESNTKLRLKKCISFKHFFNYIYIFELRSTLEKELNTYMYLKLHFFSYFSLPCYSLQEMRRRKMIYDSIHSSLASSVSRETYCTFPGPICRHPVYSTCI